jgi:hypothetical protein
VRWRSCASRVGVASRQGLLLECWKRFQVAHQAWSLTSLKMGQSIAMPDGKRSMNTFYKYRLPIRVTC